MIRLTKRDMNGEIYFDVPDDICEIDKYGNKLSVIKYGGQVLFDDIAIKLAAYEDTGFEPEEVETLKAENAELKRLLSLAVEEIKGAANLICDIAKHDDSCPFFDYAKRQCGGTWRHADEAEKLLGGIENESIH